MGVQLVLLGHVLLLLQDLGVTVQEEQKQKPGQTLHAHTLIQQLRVKHNGNNEQKAPTRSMRCWARSHRDAIVSNDACTCCMREAVATDAVSTNSTKTDLSHVERMRKIPVNSRLG